MAITARKLRRLEAWSNWRAAGGTRQAVVEDAITVRGSTTINDERISVTVPLGSSAAASLGAGKIITVDQTDAHTNLILWSQDYSNAAYQKRGTGTVTANTVLAPDGTMTGDTLSGIAAAGNDVFQNVTGLVAGNRYEPSFWVQKISTNDTIIFSNPATTAAGEWRVDLNKLGNGWERITRGHPAVTIITEWVAHSSGVSGHFWRSLSGSPISFNLWGSQLEPGRITTDYIPTTTVAVTVAAIFDEYRIIDRAFDDDESKIVITAASLKLTDLGSAGLVFRKDSDGVVVYDFEILSLTATEHINSWILPALAAAGYSWITLGTVSSSARFDMTYSWDTPLSALIRIAEAAVCELDIARNGSAGYTINIVPKINSSAQRADLRTDKNLVNVTRVESSVSQATRVTPKGAAQDEFHATMARASWLVSVIAGSILTLADPAGGKGPIAFDNQLNGLYLRKPNGTLTLVSATTASNNTVAVASVAALAVGDLVQFRADSAGADLTYLDNPAAIAAYGIKLGVRDVEDVPVTNNLIKNPVMRSWPGTLPDNWTAVNAPTIAKQTAAPFTALGGASIKVTSTTDGQGVISDAVSIFPTAANPYASGFAKVWVASGNVRVELVFTTPSGTKIFPVLPDVASATVLGQWLDLGASGFDANAVAATAVAIRVVQHSAAASVFYVDAAQATASPAQQPFFEGSGGTRLWQEANAALLENSSPIASYTVPLADLEAYDPITWSESALIIGADAHVVDPRLAIDIITRIVGIERDYIDPQASSVTLSNRPQDLTDIITNVTRPERDPGASDDPLTNPQQPKLSASFDINGQLIINSFGDNDVTSQRIAWATGSAPSAATVRAATPINQQNISGLATGSTYPQGTTVFIAAFTYNARGFESSPLAVVSESRQGAIIDYTPFASNLTPVKIVSVLPGSGAFVGEIVFLTTDKKLYRWTGSAWTNAVDTVDLTGQIQTAQIANLAVTSAQIGASAVIAGKIAANAVGSTEIASLSVTNAKIAANAVDTGKIAALAVTTTELAALAVTGAKIAALTITAGNIAAHTISANEIAAFTITAAEIAAGAITSGKIAAGSITAGKIAIGSGGAALNSDPGTSDITAWEYLGGAAPATIVTLTDGKVGPTALRGAPFAEHVSHSQPYDPQKSYRVRLWARQNGTANGVLYAGIGIRDHAGNLIGPGANYIYIAASGATPPTTWTEYSGVLPANYGLFSGVPETMQIAVFLNYVGTTGYMEAQDVRLEEVLPGTLIMDGAIITNKLAANAVTAAKIAADTITAAEIQAGAITSSELAANSVIAGKIAALSITAAEIAASTITGAKIAANTITASNILANTITAGQIQAGAISATEIAAGAITTGKIAAGTVTATELAVGTITADRIVAGSLTLTQMAHVRGKWHRGANTSVPNNTDTKAIIDTADIDPNSMYDAAGGGFKIPAGTATAFYLVRAYLKWDGTAGGTNANGTRQMYLMKNGSPMSDTAVTGKPLIGFRGASGGLEQVTSWFGQLAANDPVCVGGFQDSGGSLNFAVVYLEVLGFVA